MSNKWYDAINNILERPWTISEITSGLCTVRCVDEFSEKQLEYVFQQKFKYFIYSNIIYIMATGPAHYEGKQTLFQSFFAMKAFDGTGVLESVSKSKYTILVH